MSEGIKKAEELTAGLSAQASSLNRCQKADDQSYGKVVRNHLGFIILFRNIQCKNIEFKLSLL